MARWPTLLILVLALLSGRGAMAQNVVMPLDAQTLKDALRTRDANEETYLTYIAALVEHGQLSRDLVASTFKWALGKPDPQKTQYFKRALTLRAAELGITLPTDTPSTMGTIEGRCYVHLLWVDIPAAGVTVNLGDTGRTAVTNARGLFEFDDVPYGVYDITARGIVSLLIRTGSASVAIPSPPPSTEPATVSIRMR